MIDGGAKERMIDLIFKAQVNGYAGAGRYVYEQTSYKMLEKTLAETRLALMSSSGHFVQGDDPKPLGVDDMSQSEAEARINDFVKEEPHLSEIPIDINQKMLRVRHGGYDVRGAQKDANVNFPINRMSELRDEGILPNLHPVAYSFVGACSQMRLQKETGPQWVEKFKDSQIEALLLIPV